MEDEAAREQLLSRIRILIATRKNTQVKPPVESAGAQLIATLSENVKETSRQLVATADALRDVPALFASVQDQVTNPKYRQQWFDLLIKVTLILFAGGLAERLVRLLLRRTRRTLEEREEADTLWVRLSLLAGRTVLDLVPIAAFAAAAYAVAPVVRPAPEVHVIALTLINAYLIVPLYFGRGPYAAGASGEDPSHPAADGRHCQLPVHLGSGGWWAFPFSASSSQKRRCCWDYRRADIRLCCACWGW